MPDAVELPTPTRLDVRTCLAAQNRRALIALARANGWPFDTARSKAAAVETLAQRVESLTRLAAVCAGLTPELQTALRALLDAGGQMARGDFVYRFGELRPYRPWRADSPAAPWENPISPTEALFYRALIFPINLGTPERPQPAIVLPQEYHATLAALFHTPPSPSPPPSLSPPLPLLSDLFTWLSFLNRIAVRPLHQRWLPPWTLRALAAWITTAAPSAPSRSERRWPYLAFLHYLAERAALVGLTGGLLKPTAAALAWLELPEPARWQSLWTVWSVPDAENAALWTRYRLPLTATEDPPARFAQVCAALRTTLTGSPIALPVLWDTLQQRAPELFRPTTAYQSWAALDPDAQAEYRETLLAELHTLATGPLAWFGIVHITADDLALTPAGTALWERAGGVWPAASPLSGLIVRAETSPEQTEPRLWLRVVTPPPEDTPGLTLVQRLHLERYAPPDPANPDAYELTAPNVLSACQQGDTVAGLLALLEAAAGPLPPLLVATLYRWAATLEQVRVRHVVVLETRDAALLQTLTRQRSIRELTRETFSARVVRVDAAQLDALLRRLARQGIIPEVEVPAGAGAERGASAEYSAPDERAVIAAALHVYAHLADVLGAPVDAPHALAQTWQRALDLPQRDAAERLAAAVLSALQRAVPPETDDHLPAPTGPLIETLETAIAQETTLDITYYTAGRDHTTRRRISPLRLEWRGDVVYLIAYCHLRQDERIFRVDRIECIGQQTTLTQ
jgi:hypothetical protein